MSEELKVFMNGTFVPTSEAKVSVYDHGLLYGDGIFEGIRAYNGRVFRLEAHIDRLFDSAKMIYLDISMTKQEVMDAVIDTLRINNLEDAYVRLVVTRGVGDLGFSVKKCKGARTMFIIAKPASAFVNPEGITAITSTIRRVPPEVFSPNIKSLNYLNNILAHTEAEMHGTDEAVMLDMHGNVAEGTGSNIFMVKDDKLITPPFINSLRGITREVVLEVLTDEYHYSMKTEVRNFSLFELYAADEIFVTGTADEIAPILKLDGRLIADGKRGKHTLELQSEFKGYVSRNGYPIY